MADGWELAGGITEDLPVLPLPDEDLFNWLEPEDLVAPVKGDTEGFDDASLEDNDIGACLVDCTGAFFDANADMPFGPGVPGSMMQFKS